MPAPPSRPPVLAPYSPPKIRPEFTTSDGHVIPAEEYQPSLVAEPQIAQDDMGYMPPAPARITFASVWRAIWFLRAVLIAGVVAVLWWVL